MFTWLLLQLFPSTFPLASYPPPMPPPLHLLMISISSMSSPVRHPLSFLLPSAPPPFVCTFRTEESSPPILSLHPPPPSFHLLNICPNSPPPPFLSVCAQLLDFFLFCLLSSLLPLPPSYLPTTHFASYPLLFNISPPPSCALPPPLTSLSPVMTLLL